MAERKTEIQLTLPISSDAIARRLLDAIAASAQLVAPELMCRWGQHIWTERGDNLVQYGLHGSAQAVMALAAGAKYFSAPNRYSSLLVRGRSYLETLLDKPKKPLDVRKVLKLSELVTALGDANAKAALIERGAQLLIDGRVTGTDGWDFDLALEHRRSAHYLPTLYAAASMVRACSVHSNAREVLDHALAFSLNALREETSLEKRAAAFLWLYHLNGVYQRTLGSASPIASAVDSGVVEHIAGERCLLTDHVTFDYQLSDSGEGDSHAFCRIPVGLFQFYCELSCSARGIDIDGLKDRLEGRVSELVDVVFGGPQLSLSNGYEFSGRYSAVKTRLD